ncbi:MAG: DUF411 domain-containing protein [Bacteroidota bacterium]
MILRRAALVVALLLAALAGAAAYVHVTTPAPGAKVVEVWKSQTCGCCTSWIAYMEDNGYAVTVHDVDDVDPIKDQFNVPTELRSCHTARIDGYVIEGHVPVEAIAKLVADKPKTVEGIAVPGMPPGAPGMDEDDSPYPVLTFGAGKIAPLYGRQG